MQWSLSLWKLLPATMDHNTPTCHCQHANTPLPTRQPVCVSLSQENEVLFVFPPQTPDGDMTIVNTFSLVENSSIFYSRLSIISWSINQSYIALLYIPEVALQSPESSSHSYTVIPVVVSYLSSHSCPGAD